jgi:flagellar hook protein FlgE
MLGSIFNSMSGLLAFSKGLDTISSNVSNMNTPGFKSSELQFTDVFYRSQFSSLENGQTAFSQKGSGVDTGSTNTRFNQGEIRSTGEDLDVAIDGNGFFVFKKDNETLYSRAGQLAFDDNGFLVSRSNQARISALNASGGLQDINLNDFSTIPQSPTTEIKFTGILSTGTQNTNGDPIHEITDVKVFDSLGTERTLTINFERTNLNPIEWRIDVLEGTTNIGTGTVQYDPSGDPVANSNELIVNLTASDSSLTSFTIRMGEPGASDASSSSSFGTSSTLSVLSSDGFAAGSLVSTTIDNKGVLSSEYSNGETREHLQLAVASFVQLQGLERGTGGMFTAGPDMQATLGKPDEGGLGQIVPRSIELSNVELTQQFGDLIIVQRGFQSSSQVLTASNEMLQQLIEMRGRG